MGIFKIGFSILGFSIPILWEICLAIDSIIYQVADFALQAFFEMAALSSNVQAYSEEISWILNRVMVLAGVYALFKLAIMLINYIIEPDKMNEVNKNGADFVKGILIAVVLLVSSQFIFNILGDFQRLVVEQEVIPKLVYGPERFDDEENSIPRQATRFVNNVFLLFFTPNDSCENGGAFYCDDYNRVLEAENGVGISSLIAYASAPYFDYLPFISGIVGMMLVYYFAVYAIELGVRIVKLVVLQVISPIPIIMSIDPSQKNKLDNFVKTYSSIYLQIFIRILTMYLAFVVVGLISRWDTFVDATGSAAVNGMFLEVGFFIKVLLYIGVFQATKELPKLFEDALGVKMGNAPGQSFGHVLGSIIGGSVGLAGGAVAGGLAGGAGGALAGAASGMLSGAAGVAGSKNAGAAVGAAVKSIKGSYATGGKVAGAGGLGGFLLGKVDNFTGRNNRIDERVSQAESKVSALENFETVLLNDYSRSIDPTTGNKRGTMDEDARVVSAQLALEQYKEVQRTSGVPVNSGVLQSHYAAIESAKDAYKKDAFKWFEAKSLDSAGKVKYNPRQYTTLSDSERAHHEITRINKGKAILPDGGKDLRGVYKDTLKADKQTAKDLKLEKDSDRFRNASAAK